MPGWRTFLSTPRCVAPAMRRRGAWWVAGASPALRGAGGDVGQVDELRVVLGGGDEISARGAELFLHALVILFASRNGDEIGRELVAELVDGRERPAWRDVDAHDGPLGRF